MEAICRVKGISRQAHYQKRRREESKRAEEEKVLTMVRMIRRRHPYMGVRKLLVKMKPMMEQEGIKIGRDRLFELMRANDLLVKRRRRKNRTTWPGVKRMSNLLVGEVIDRPNKVWVADITYIEMSNGRFRYLFIVMDLYSRKVVGWSLGKTLEWGNALSALEMAVENAGGEVKGLIHHSDHGSQYSSRGYLEYLGIKGIRASMGEVGNAYDNAYAERVMGTLKREYGLGEVFKVGIERAVEEAIELYNEERPHQSLRYATPSEVYSGEVEIEGF